MVGAVGWGNAQLEVPPEVDPAMAALMASCWAEPGERPSFAQLIVSLKELAHARGLYTVTPLTPLVPARRT